MILLRNIKLIILQNRIIIALETNLMVIISLIFDLLLLDLGILKENKNIKE